MLAIGKLSAAAVDYYTEQLSHSVGEDVPVLRGGGSDRRVDYYAGYQAPARWMGSGLESAGVVPSSPVSKEAFAQLMGHKTVSGESMTRAHASHGSVAAFDPHPVGSEVGIPPLRLRGQPNPAAGSGGSLGSGSRDGRVHGGSLRPGTSRNAVARRGGWLAYFNSQRRLGGVGGRSV